MPAFESITVTDRAATPNNVVFDPRSRAGDSAIYGTSETAAIADKTLFLSVNNKTKRRVQLRLKVPVTADQTVDGVTYTVAERFAFANVDLTFEKSSTEQERKDAVGMLADFLNSVDIASVLSGRDSIY